MEDRIRSAGDKALTQAREHDFNEVDALTYEAGALFGAQEVLLYDDAAVETIARTIYTEETAGEETAGEDTGCTQQWEKLSDTAKAQFFAEAEHSLRLAGMARRDDAAQAGATGIGDDEHTADTDSTEGGR